MPKHKLISCERAFKMLKNDMYIIGIGQAVLEVLNFEFGPGNHQRGISLSFGNHRKYEVRFMENNVTSDKSQFPKIRN